MQRVKQGLMDNQKLLKTDFCLKEVLHLRNLLTHSLLFWHFLENFNFELKNTLGYIRTMFFGKACLFSEKTDSEHLKY